MRVARELTQLDSLLRWRCEQDIRTLLSSNTLPNRMVTWKWSGSRKIKMEDFS